MIIGNTNIISLFVMIQTTCIKYYTYLIMKKRKKIFLILQIIIEKFEIDFSRSMGVYCTIITQFDSYTLEKHFKTKLLF